MGQHRTTFRIVPNHEVRDVGPLHVRQRQWTRGELHQHGRGQAGLRDHGQCVPWRSQVMTWGSSDTGMLFLMWVKQCHKLSPRKITIFIGGINLPFPNGWFMALFYPHYFRMFCVVGRSQLHHRLCFGIYDANCDGPSYENPVKIVKAAWCRAGWWIFSTFFFKG